MATQLEAPPKSKIAAAMHAFGQGERQRAYTLSLQATAEEPQDCEAWFARSVTAPSAEEKLLCLSRAQALCPKDPRIKGQLYFRVRDFLERDPFLAYLEETDEVYRVRNNGELILTVAKDRAVPERFPASTPPRMQSMSRLLGLALLGLIPSGLGALLFAPLLGLLALSALTQPLDRADRVRAQTALLAAVVLFILALGLSYFFWLHLTG